MLTQAFPLPPGCKTDAVAPDIMSEFKAERREARTAMSVPLIGKVKFSRKCSQPASIWIHWPEWIIGPPLVAREVAKLGNRIVTVIWCCACGHHRKEEEGRMEGVEATTVALSDLLCSHISMQRTSN